MRPLLAVALVIGAALVAISAATGPGTMDPVVLAPENLEWTPRDSGVQVAVLHGDPSKEGTFTLRLRYPAGYRKGPHFHPRDAYVTVLEGSYYRGYGSVFDESRGIPLKPGTFSLNPAKVAHYEWTTEPALLQVTAVGPWTTVYVDPRGKPREGPR